MNLTEERQDWTVWVFWVYPYSSPTMSSDDEEYMRALTIGIVLAIVIILILYIFGICLTVRKNSVLREDLAKYIMPPSFSMFPSFKRSSVFPEQAAAQQTQRPPPPPPSSKGYKNPPIDVIL
ncbi:protein ORF37 [Cyprinid herpesvirus 1]|uniref:Protein ORF37 n=1 Tax=Cyprinid herpesvirus 1 TaxID=317858 RepID=K7PBK9_9VIRU|nr:protein ORF37 [Cyprinid herpesvirus 1]AFJ20341.1 protein ORF37 [Cyprinid herpesvirus 1]